MEITPIDEMANLKARLGKKGVEKVRYNQNRGGGVKRTSYDVVNTVIAKMQYMKPNEPCNTVDDLLAGACSNFGDRQNLDLNRIYRMFQTMPVINNAEVVKMAGISQRQSSKYVRAARFVLPYLEEYFEDEAGDEFEPWEV